MIKKIRNSNSKKEAEGKKKGKRGKKLLSYIKKKRLLSKEPHTFKIFISIKAISSHHFAKKPK